MRELGRRWRDGPNNNSPRNSPSADEENLSLNLARALSLSAKNSPKNSPGAENLDLARALSLSMTEQ